MTKLRKPLTVEYVLSQAINKLDKDEVKNITNKSISHFRKCSDPDDKDHNLHYADAIKLDILMQRKALGTPFIDNFSLLIEDEFNKNNVYENVASTLIKIGGRMGNLMDTTQQAMSPDSQMGKEISKKEKDQIFKAINEVEESLSLLKEAAKQSKTIKTWAREDEIFEKFQVRNATPSMIADCVYNICQQLELSLIHI